ncbi:hypothetical protein LNK15_13215, partial [Jeotgalicoccus huakuii]|nr:hypothetical protein [Jeotgalicoccus huakuii]
QGWPVTGGRQQFVEVIEYLTYPQLGVVQAKGGQAGGIKGMGSFTGVLQQDDAGAAFERGEQWAEAMGERALAALAAGSGHGVLLGGNSLP